MSTRPREVTPALLRGRPLPGEAGSKYSRGRVLIVGGAATTPGAAQLAGLAALRVGAGHLTLAVAESVAVALAVATPEAGVIGLPQNAAGSVLGDDLSLIADDLSSADVVAVGPGLNDADQTRALLRQLIPQLGEEATLVLDAYALGVLADLVDLLEPLATVWSSPRTRTRHRDCWAARSNPPSTRSPRSPAAIAPWCRVRAWLPTPKATAGRSEPGTPDSPRRAAATCWQERSPDCWPAARTPLRRCAGPVMSTPPPVTRLAVKVGSLGSLARELLDELPHVIVELQA